MGYSDYSGPIRVSTAEEAALAHTKKQEQASDIGALITFLLAGPALGANQEACEIWISDARRWAEKYRIAGGFRALDGGADILEAVDRIIRSYERVIEQKSR